MRIALIVAPWDPRSSDAPAWSDAVAWLGATLASLGFRVSVLDGGDDVEGRVTRALDKVAPNDTLLLHVSGRLARRGVIGTMDGAWVPLRALGAAVASRRLSDASILADLSH